MPDMRQTSGALTRIGDRGTVLESNLIGGADAVAEGVDSMSASSEGEFNPIYSDRVPSGAIFAVGFGTDNRERGRNAYAHADIQTSVPGPIGGELWARVRDSRNRRTLASTPIGDLQDLRDAASDARTDKPLMPVMVPAAKEDRYVQFGVVVNSGSDGDTPSAADSDVRLYYTDVDL